MQTPICTTDLDGDDRPDLVWTDEDKYGYPYVWGIDGGGALHWNVFFNTP